MNDAIEDVWSPLMEARFDVDGDRVAASSLDLDSRLSSLDDELLMMNRAIATAKKRRNMLTAAYRTPAEVLSIIFSLARTGWFPSAVESSNGALTYNYGWIYLTHVSSYWREVAVQTPSLWADPIYCLEIPFDYVPYILERSRSLPLRWMVGRVNQPTPNNVEQWVSTWFNSAAVSERIRSLDIEVDEVDFGTLAPYLQYPMINLVDLTVQMDSGDEVGVIRLPHTFCPGTEHLAKLYLLDFIPHWDSSLFCASLTHLSMRYTVDPDPEYIPTREQLFGLLSSLTSLQYLSIHNAFPHVPPPNAPNTVITLPSSLKHVDLETSQIHARCLRFMPSLSFAPSTCVDIKVKEIGGDLEMEDLPLELTEALLPMLDPAISALHSSRGRHAPPVEIIVEQYGLTFHTAELFRSSWTIKISFETELEGALSFSVRVGREVDPSGGCCLCRRLLSLPLHDIRAISFARHAVIEMNRVNVLPDLVRAQAVRRLGIDIKDSASLMNVLSERLPDGTFKVFPLLEILHVHLDYDYRRTRVSGSSNVQKELPQQSACISDALALADFVAARGDGGAPLREIVVEKALADWDIWDVVRSEVPVTLFDF
ncbi:hypothetical protein PENSPDRAFT_648759 [Peniophora sp. CONT]|nr:hypothetical protein PENSPDRAFT_648759 [Peniophora sp. CONT]